MAYQSEAALEQQFIDQLNKQSYTSVSIPDYDALVWFSPPVCGFCYAVKTAFSGIKDKCIAYPLRAVKKALIYGGLEYPKA